MDIEIVSGVLKNAGCMLCPRGCGAIRENGEKGFCKEGTVIRAARASLHAWEEPCISGQKGSGTVFFTGCVLGCVYCQNKTISRGSEGVCLTPSELSDVFLRLQENGAENINLVTPEHFIFGIREALEIAKDKGLLLPVVMNTSSFVTVKALEMLDGLVDVYLPDLKYFSKELSKKYSGAPEYFEAASAAIAHMARAAGEIEFLDKESGKRLSAAEYNDLDTDSDDGREIIMTKGVIVRHLLLPGCTEDSKRVIDYLYRTYGDSIYISIMNQYTPVEGLEKFKELQRKVTDEEYEEILDFAIELGIENCFFQTGDTAQESFIPDFKERGFLVK